VLRLLRFCVLGSGAEPGHLGVQFSGRAIPVLPRIGRIKFWSWDCISAGVQTQFSEEIGGESSTLAIGSEENQQILVQRQRNQTKKQFTELSLKGLAETG
jgi:hypothetical protein